METMDSARDEFMEKHNELQEAKGKCRDAEGDKAADKAEKKLDEADLGAASKIKKGQKMTTDGKSGFDDTAKNVTAQSEEINKAGFDTAGEKGKGGREGKGKGKEE